MPSREDESLGAYRGKRDPSRTNEPFSAERSSSTAPTLRGRFVVHLHDATRRHYDVRLEIGGVLKSFAVPKGPSLDPADKRLAIHTEDHPLSYLDFEDVIPEGNYGAGPMIAWDQGTVRYLEGSAEDGLARDKLDFQLNGHKLRGRFALVHTGGREDREDDQWLLIKKEDAFSGARDVTSEQPHSVLSGLLVEELAQAPEKVRELVATADALGAAPGAVQAAARTPMRCATRGARPDDPARLYELKLDGVRILAEKREGVATLRYRSGRSASAAYPEIARALRALPVRAVVLDGEIVAFDEEGRPSFQRLGRRIHLTRPHDVARARAEVPVTFMVFDVLEIEDRDLTALPLTDRKRLLAELLPGKGLLRALDHLDGDGRPLMRFCEQHGLEGIVAKKKDAPYVFGPKRSDAWVKLKIRRQDDLVVVGWEESDKSRKLKNLILAAHDDTGALVLRGKVGSGFDEAAIDDWLERLPAMETDAPPARGPLTEGGTRHWVRPEHVVSVEHAGLSDGGTLRAPAYRGLREDLDPVDCRLVSASEVIERAGVQPSGSLPEGMRQAREVAARAKLSNQDKVFWPDEGFTKGDLCNYYASVAEPLLAFSRDRPIVLVRHPDGIEGKSFYQWNVPKGTPSWLRHVKMPDDEARGKQGKRMFLVDDVDGLLHIANLGCIPIHVLAARENSRERCDFLTIDFDLGGQPFSHAVTLALSLRQILDDIGLEGFPKTSGKSGMHVLIGLGARVGFDTAKRLVELLGRLLVDRHGDIATMERIVEKRGDRVYVDTGQTGRSRTIVAPYSVRAVPGATVSTPLLWDELHLALDPSEHTMFTVPARLRSVGDPMAQLLEAEPDIGRAVERLGRMLPSGG